VFSPLVEGYVSAEWTNWPECLGSSLATAPNTLPNARTFHHCSRSLNQRHEACEKIKPMTTTTNLFDLNTRLIAHTATALLSSYDIEPLVDYELADIMGFINIKLRTYVTVVPACLIS
jgi:hypothetical protein